MLGRRHVPGLAELGARVEHGSRVPTGDAQRRRVGEGVVPRRRQRADPEREVDVRCPRVAGDHDEVGLARCRVEDDAHRVVAVTADQPQAPGRLADVHGERGAGMGREVVLDGDRYATDRSERVPDRPVAVLRLAGLARGAGERAGHRGGERADRRRGRSGVVRGRCRGCGGGGDQDAGCGGDHWQRGAPQGLGSLRARGKHEFRIASRSVRRTPPRVGGAPTPAGLSAGRSASRPAARRRPTARRGPSRTHRRR